MTTVLITGYSGFIGSYLIDVLDSHFHLKLLGRTKPSPVYNFFYGSIDSHSDYTSALVDVDVVIHLAGRVHITNDQALNPIEEFREVNVKGTLNLANQAVDAGVTRFIYISSIKVSGDKSPIDIPFTYSSQYDPRDPYSLSKSEAERQLYLLAVQSGMEYVFIRPPLVYGNAAKANFSALMNLVGKSLPLPFGAINSNKRSFVFLGNLVDLIKTCIEHTNAANQTFLVSDGDDLSTSQLVKLMAEAQGVNSILLPVPPWLLSIFGKLTGKSDMISLLTDSLCADITHTQDSLGWTPPFSVREGFAKCFEKRNV